MKNKIRVYGFLLFVFVWSTLNGQKSVDAKRLDIYAVNFYSLPILLEKCDYNSNYVRAKPVYSIQIKESNMVNELKELFLTNIKNNSMPLEEQFTSRVVFDFSKDDVIVLTVSLNEFGEMIANEDTTIYFEPNDLIMDRIQYYCPFIGQFLKQKK